jgi:CheY-like chemotaxis protein
MGGDIACHSRPGEGSRFVVALPLPGCVAPVSMAPGVPVAREGGVRGRVLLVEDNAVNAMVAEAMLSRAGAQVEVVHDGTQAIERARATRFDLILMDCQMPGIDGFEATRAIRADERRAGLAPAPIVALTANALEGDRQRSLAAGMDDHLAKPFREDDLAGVLRSYVERA